MQLLERRAGAEEAQARPDARDVGVDRHVRQPEREQQHAGGGLAATPGSAVSYARASSTGSPPRKSRSGGSVSARRISWIRTDFWRCRPPGWIAASTSSSGASRTASQGEALAQAQVGDVAVAVVGRLREDGEDQLSSPWPWGGATGRP